MNNGKWCVTGLAKYSTGFGHIIYMSFTEDMATVVKDEYSGYIRRYLTYGELGDTNDYGYGVLPYGQRGRFDAQGNLVELI